MNILRPEGNFKSTQGEVAHLMANGYCLLTYFSNIPCRSKTHPEGQPTERYTATPQYRSSQRCAVCARVKHAKFYSENKEECKAKSAARINENRAAHIASSKIYQDRYRAKKLAESQVVV